MIVIKILVAFTISKSLLFSTDEELLDNTVELKLLNFEKKNLKIC